jgi:hypothetical protein
MLRQSTTGGPSDSPAYNFSRKETLWLQKTWKRSVLHMTVNRGVPTGCFNSRPLSGPEQAKSQGRAVHLAVPLSDHWSFSKVSAFCPYFFLCTLYGASRLPGSKSPFNHRTTLSAPFMYMAWELSLRSLVSTAEQYDLRAA